MAKISFEILLHDYPEISEVKDLRSTCTANCMFTSFSPIRHHIKHCYNPRDKKNFVVGKDFNNLAPESCSFKCWCWFIESTILQVTSSQAATTNQPRL